MAHRPALAFVLWLGALGCASNYYDSYKGANPDWAGDFPTRGASLHETLAGLYAPPVAGYRRFVSKVDVLRLDPSGAATVLSKPEIDAALREPAGHYAVVATVGCRSEVDMKVYSGEKVAWLLLPDGHLAAWDTFDFVDRCTVWNDFAPARPEFAALERAVVAHRDANFPRSMEHVVELYRKGLRYADVGRPDDAASMLRRGDAAFDVGQRGERHVDFENAPSALREADADDAQRTREELVRRLGAVGSGAAQAPHPQESSTEP